MGAHTLDVYGNVIFVDSGNNPVTSIGGMYLPGESGDTRHWIRADDLLTYDVGLEKIVSWACTSSPDNMMSVTDIADYICYSYTENGMNLYGENLHATSLAPSVTEAMPYVLGALMVVLVVLVFAPAIYGGGACYDP